MPTLYALLLVVLLMTSVRVLAPPSRLDELRDDTTRAVAARARVALVVVVIALVGLAAHCRDQEADGTRDDVDRTARIHSAGATTVARSF